MVGTYSLHFLSMFFPKCLIIFQSSARSAYNDQSIMKINFKKIEENCLFKKEIIKFRYYNEVWFTTYVISRKCRYVYVSHALRWQSTILGFRITKIVNKHLHKKNIIRWPSTVSNYGLFCHVKCKAFLVLYLKALMIIYIVLL